jgi:hypothetical protein
MGASLRALLSLLAGCAIVAAAPMARATPNFPDALRAKVPLSYTPPCTICHATLEGGTGTVVQKFGIAMRARGLQPNDETTLANALTKMKADNVDSDGDGTNDVDELAAGKDPNTGKVLATPGADGGAAADTIGPPMVGCGGAHVAPYRARGVAAGLVGALGFVLAAVARRRTRRRRV